MPPAKSNNKFDLLVKLRSQFKKLIYTPNEKSKPTDHQNDQISRQKNEPENSDEIETLTIDKQEPIWSIQLSKTSLNKCNSEFVQEKMQETNVRDDANSESSKSNNEAQHLKNLNLTKNSSESRLNKFRVLYVRKRKKNLKCNESISSKMLENNYFSSFKHSKRTILSQDAKISIDDLLKAKITKSKIIINLLKEKGIYVNASQIKNYVKQLNKQKLK